MAPEAGARDEIASAEDASAEDDLCRPQVVEELAPSPDGASFRAGSDVTGLNAASQSDLVFPGINGGVDTQITGMTSQTGDALILKGVGVVAASAANFTFDPSAGA